MSINPSEYDLRELRRLAGVRENEQLGERDTDRKRSGRPSGVSGGSAVDEANAGAKTDATAGSTATHPAEATDPAQASAATLSRHLFSGALRPGAVTRWNRFEELLEYQLQATDEMLTQPYLTALPGSYTGVAIVFEWLEFLLSKAGQRQTIEALQYYRSIGWISRDAQDRLEAYLAGITDPQPDVERGLTKDDHRLSLLYVVRLLAEADDM